MKTIIDYISESPVEVVDDFKASFLGFNDEDGMPISVKIMVPRGKGNDFIEFAKKNDVFTNVDNKFTTHPYVANHFCKK